MPYVPAHTNAVGNFSLAQATSSRKLQQIAPTVSTVGNTNSGLIYHSRSYKSPTIPGGESPLVPGFRKPTAYQRIVSRFDSASGAWDMTYRTGVSQQWRIWGDNPRHTSVLRPLYPSTPSTFNGLTEDLNLRSRCEAEALSKLQQGSLNLGAALGELKETFNMVSSSLYTLSRFLLYFRNRRYSDAWRALFQNQSVPVTVQRTIRDLRRNPLSLWLSWAYGWRPLLSDIFSGVELIQKGFREKYLLFNVTRTITIPRSSADFISGQSPSLLTFEGKGTESCRVKFWAMVTSDLSVLNSLGLINPLSLAWELTRLSFVVDWALPVGMWLESLSATLGITFVAGCRTYEIYGDIVGCDPRQAATASIALSQGYAWGGSPPKARHRFINVKRSTYSTWPWVLPYWKNPLSTETATSAVALLAQIRR